MTSLRTLPVLGEPAGGVHAEMARIAAAPALDPPLLDDWRELRSILAVRLDAMGDVLMTSPAFRAIRESARSGRLTVLTSTSGAIAARHIPEVDHVIAYDPPWMKASAARSDAGADRALIEELRARAFDAAVVFTVHSQNPLPSVLACYYADIPRRLAHCRENPYQLLTAWVPEPETDAPTRHEVRRQLDLVAHVGLRTTNEDLSFRVPPEAMRHLRNVLLPAAGISLDDPFVVIHPGATAPSRRYPPAGMAVAARLLARDGLPVVFTGSADERDLVEEIRDAMGAPSVSFAGRLSIGELSALIAVAPVLVSNNSGPVHLAAALRTPVVDLYALTNLQHTPWNVPQRTLAVDVPCAGCRRSVCPMGHHRCLAGIEPTDIRDAVRRLLAETWRCPSGAAARRTTAFAGGGTPRRSRRGCRPGPTLL